MTAYQLLTTLFYFSLVAFALIRSWSHYGRRQVGVVLLLAWVASNLVFWTLTPIQRPAAFSFIEVLFALTCAKAGKETDSRVAIALITLSVLSICANVAFSWSTTRSYNQIHIYELACNAIFAAQCLVTGFWGAADEFLRTGRIPWRAGDSGGAPELAHHTKKAR